MPKIKKYLSKSDKYRGIISPEYAESLRLKKLNKKWEKETKQKVINTLPNRLAENFHTYNFSKLPQKNICSMFIYGEVGTGKTVACAYYYVEFVKQMYLKMSSFTKTHYFIVYSKLMEDLQKNYQDSDDLMKKYMECDLLVIDEFGVKKLTEFVYDRIYLLINERYLNNLPTIINSNSSLEEIGKKFNDARIPRRIEEDYELIKKIHDYEKENIILHSNRRIELHYSNTCQV